MLPQDQLQQFIVRAVTGHGERVQADVNDAMMKVRADYSVMIITEIYSSPSSDSVATMSIEHS